METLYQHTPQSTMLTIVMCIAIVFTTFILGISISEWIERKFKD